MPNELEHDGSFEGITVKPVESLVVLGEEHVSAGVEDILKKHLEELFLYSSSLVVGDLSNEF